MTVLIKSRQARSCSPQLIYQIKAEPHLKYHRFTSLKKLRAMDEDVDIKNYNCVYQGSMPPAGQVIDTLYTIYEKFNIDRPDNFKGYSLPVSDVIVTRIWTR